MLLICTMPLKEKLNLNLISIHYEQLHCQKKIYWLFQNALRSDHKNHRTWCKTNLHPRRVSPKYFLIDVYLSSAKLSFMQFILCVIAILLVFYNATAGVGISTIVVTISESSRALQLHKDEMYPLSHKLMMISQERVE